MKRVSDNDTGIYEKKNQNLDQQNELFINFKRPAVAADTAEIMIQNTKMSDVDIDLDSPATFMKPSNLKARGAAHQRNY